MAMNYQNFASLGVNLNRQKYGPLDISSVFTSEADLRYYLSKGAETEGVSEYWYKNANEKIVPYPYEGQVIATVINDDVKVYVLRLDAEGAFEAKAIEPEVDGKTIKLTNGKLELVGLPTDTSKVYVPSLVNGVLTWAEPDTSTAEGQQQAIEGLTASVAGLSEILNGKAADEEAGTEAVVGLVDKVAALEAIDNATQAELDTYKEVVTAAIAAGVKEAKDYADAQDADTIYDDADLQNRVKAIEDDYLKEEDKYDDTAVKGRLDIIESDYLKKSDETIYDDTALAGRVTTVENKVADLEAAVEAIDYVDADELASALAPINEALGAKAAQSDLETLKGRVDTFFEGTGVENVIDTLEDLIKYINEHDDLEVSGILSSIEAIEGKLEGVESTVAAYVTAAIDALKIGDYAKAADLTTLAGRVSVLEAKPFDTYATKTEVETVAGDLADYIEANDAALAGVKATAEAAAVKTDVETALAGKVDNETLNNYYTSEEIEAKGYAIASEVESTYATKSELTEAVEGIENDLLAYAKTADVTAELAKKIESGSIAHSSESAVESVTVDGTKLNIVVDAYTKSETREYVAEVIRDMTGGESAADVLRDLNAHITTYTEKVGQIDAKDAAQDTAITAAQTQADKGVADAAKVAADLATANLTIADNTREIGVVKDSISGINTTLTEKITALEGKDTVIEGNITALQTTVGGHTTTITEQGVAIAALQDEDTRLATLIQGNTDKFAGYYTKSEVDTAVQTAIDKIPEVDFTGYATETYVNDAILVVNEEVSKKANAADVYTIAQADAKFLTEVQVKSVIDKVVADVSDTDTIEGLVTLVNYVHDNAGDIAALVSNVETNTASIAQNVKDIAANKVAHEKNASDIAELTATVAAQKVVESTEVSITAVETGIELGIKEVNVNKLIQTDGDVFVLNGGNAAN